MAFLAKPDLFSYAYTYNGAGVLDVVASANVINLIRQIFSVEPLNIAPNARQTNYRADEMPDIVSSTGVYMGTTQRINVDDVDVKLGHGMPLFFGPCLQHRTVLLCPYHYEFVFVS